MSTQISMQTVNTRLYLTINKLTLHLVSCNVIILSASLLLVNSLDCGAAGGGGGGEYFLCCVQSGLHTVTGRRLVCFSSFVAVFL